MARTVAHEATLGEPPIRVHALIVPVDMADTERVEEIRNLLNDVLELSGVEQSPALVTVDAQTVSEYGPEYV